MSTASSPSQAPNSVSNRMEQELQYYITHQAELAGKYCGKFLVIKGQQVIGVFDERLEAYTEISKTHAVGTFLIQECLPGTQAYTATYHSRVL